MVLSLSLTRLQVSHNRGCNGTRGQVHRGAQERKWWALFSLAIACICLLPQYARPQETKVGVQEIQWDRLKDSLEEYRSAHDLPGLGCALVTDKGLEHLATTGVRKRGEAQQVTDQDLWHLGSCSKAMTATLIAILVEKGILKWEKTLKDSFPDLEAKMDASMQSITLEQLLAHRSGLPANFDLVKYRNESNLTEARQRTVLDATKAVRAHEPGSGFLYSNWGYTIAASMAEVATKQTWEEMMHNEIFQPLGMTSAAFGGTGTAGEIDQPWPHFKNGKPVKINGPMTDNVSTMGPAGRIHMTIEDWGKFITENIRGRHGKSKLLSKKSYERLHQPIGDDYALGWFCVARSWGKGKVIHHNGDNTMNFAVVWCDPTAEFAVLVVTNQSSASAATDAVAAAMIRSWLQTQKKKKQP